MSADPTDPVDYSLERIANSLERLEVSMEVIAEGFRELATDRLVTRRLNREAFEQFGRADT